MSHLERRLPACVIGIAAILTITSCSRSTNDFWTTGATYDVYFKATHRVARVSELPRPATDSLHGRMTLDSVRSDSVFGRYLGRLDSLGLPVSDKDATSERIGGRIDENSFSLVIPFRALDAEVTLRGKIQGGVATGSWMGPVSPADSGVLEIHKSGK
jgi:hypothetical protein